MTTTGLKSKKIIYVSGPHGAGKSTLIQKLLGLYPQIYQPPPIEFAIKSDEKAYERAMLRAVKYKLELENYKQALESSENMTSFIVDRCIYDTLAYTGAYAKLGWISQKQKSEIFDLAMHLFEKVGFPINTLFICPSLERIQQQLHLRWQTQSIKWREDDFIYLAALTESYDTLILEYENRDTNFLKLSSPDIGPQLTQYLDIILN